MKFKEIKKFQEFLSISFLERLDQYFINYLLEKNKKLYSIFLQYRIKKKIDSEDLINIAIYLEYFLIDFFDIKSDIKKLNQIFDYNIIFNFYNIFFRKKIKFLSLKKEKILDFSFLNRWIMDAVNLNNNDKDQELKISKFGLLCIKNNDEENIKKISHWCLWVKDKRKDLKLFQLPKKNIDKNIEFRNFLLKNTQYKNNRYNFDLSGKKISNLSISKELYYCLYCHKRNRDYCSKGFLKKNTNDSIFYKNIHDEYLYGCPLKEKISEMIYLKKHEYHIASLSMIMRDNPMCAITGNRICNDCSKSCIYQKQDPVDIPAIESKVLEDILSIKWGFEIYDLLIRWNPLRKEQYIERPFNGKKILIVGMGPAGISLSHYLMMEGCLIVGIDGLKIEKLSKSFINYPIKNIKQILYKKLSMRHTLGFGGVLEYGITSRWNKNLLNILYISFLRRKKFLIYGGQRFGGSIKIEDAWKLGFDHLSLCIGSSLPKEIKLKNSMAFGIKQANEFLMNLHLGAFHENSLVNMQIRLPIIIIGSGLTAIDAATESQIFYIKQCIEIYLKNKKLSKIYKKSEIINFFSKKYNKIFFQEILEHGKIFLSLKSCKNKLIEKVRELGGVTIIYRRNIFNSPAYKNNKEELYNAFQEGIFYKENYDIKKILIDKNNHFIGVECTNIINNNIKKIYGKTLLVATGTSVNIAYSFEYKNSLERDSSQYNTYYLKNNKLIKKNSFFIKNDKIANMSSYDKYNKYISLIGDVNKSFKGSVVKAILSAKVSYNDIISSINNTNCNTIKELYYFKRHINKLFNINIVSIKNNKKYILIKIYMPILLRNYKIGNFFKLQILHNHNNIKKYKQYYTNPISSFNISKSKKYGYFLLKKNNIHNIIFENIKKKERICVMGPTGNSSILNKYSEKYKKILIIGDSDVGISYALSIASQCSNNIINFLGIKDINNDERYAINLMKKYNLHSIKWINIKNFIENKNILLEKNINLIVISCTSNKTSIIGPYIRDLYIKKFFNKNIKIFSSVYGSMQCMLKGICAQCLQMQIDPITKLNTKAVYSCSWQEQPIELIDFNNLKERSNKNSINEIINNKWLYHENKK